MTVADIGLSLRKSQLECTWKKHLGWIQSLPQCCPISTSVQGALENLLGLRSSN